MGEHAGAGTEGDIMRQLDSSTDHALSEQKRLENGLAYEMMEPTSLGGTGVQPLGCTKHATLAHDTDRPLSAETVVVSGTTDDSQSSDAWSVSTLAALSKKAAEFADALAQLQNEAMRRQEADSMLQRRASELGEELCQHFKQQSLPKILDKPASPVSCTGPTFTMDEKRWASVEARIQKVLEYHTALEEENEMLRARCAHLEHQLESLYSQRELEKKEHAALQQTMIRLRWKVRDSEGNVKKLLCKQHQLVEQVTGANTVIHQAEQQLLQLQHRIGIAPASTSKDTKGWWGTSRAPAQAKRLLAAIQHLLSLAVRWVSNLCKRPLTHPWAIVQITLSFLGFVLLTGTMDRPRPRTP